MKLRTLTLREMQRRPAQTFLTILGITLGLATVVASGLTIHAVRGAYRDLFQRVTGGLALEVTAPGLAAFDPAFARQWSEIEDVEEVSPRIHTATAVVGAAGSVSSPLVAIDTASSQADWPLSSGTPLGQGDEALLDESLANSMELAPGQLFRIWTPSGLVSLHLSGVVASQGVAAGTGGRVVISLANARRLFTIPAGQVNCLRVRLKDGAVCKRVQTDLERDLPAGLTVHAPSGHATLARLDLAGGGAGADRVGRDGSDRRGVRHPQHFPAQSRRTPAAIRPPQNARDDSRSSCGCFLARQPYSDSSEPRLAAPPGLGWRRCCSGQWNVSSAWGCPLCHWRRVP